MTTQHRLRNFYGRAYFGFGFSDGAIWGANVRVQENIVIGGYGCEPQTVEVIDPTKYAVITARGSQRLACGAVERDWQESAIYSPVRGWTPNTDFGHAFALRKALGGSDVALT